MIKVKVVYPNQNFNLIELVALPRTGETYINKDSQKKFKVAEVIHVACGSQKDHAPHIEIILEDVA